ncbi:DESIGUAL/Modifying wall lignin-1/2 [Dillenia turbinata]|uniref:DESIGUAL/Modifying wall lignin-1/2 n=1 Tax=Dillenia turbinata TaxID=194707 RepID=A0AAN8W5W2_9MAGN
MASKLLLITVFILDLIAFALAVAAEQRRTTARVATDYDKKYNYCVYDKDIATGLGVGAFFFLMLSQVFVMIASRCFCCGKALSPGGSRAWATILFLLCWVTFFIAEICLLAGSVRNAYHTRYKTIFGDNPPSCQTLRRGVFGAGAAFVFFTGILSEFYYINYAKAKAKSNFQSVTMAPIGTYTSA